jgi:CRP/FNR family transcriptional regulator
MSADWVAAVPDLAAVDEATRAYLRFVGRELRVASGTVLFRPAAPCEAYVLVIEGSVRVQMLSESGREIVLYRVEEGQSCILTTACLLGDRDYPAEAVAETEVRSVVLAAAAFQEALGRSPAFRRFVFGSFGRRLADLMMVVDEVAFRRIDLRLADLVLDRMDGDRRVTMTHQEIAAELGSVREVVSRQLKEFERRGWLALRRGRIEIVDAAALRSLADAGACVT